MKPRGIADGAAVVPLFGMAGGRRAQAELTEAFDALVASLRQADLALARRPKQLAELDRAVSRLYGVLFVQQPGGRPCVFNLLDQHHTRLELVEALCDELRARLDKLDEPRPLRAAGGAR